MEYRDPLYVSYVGPFQHDDVVVGGRVVPFLQAHHGDSGLISLTLDRRFGLDLSTADAELVVPFIANCIAVALGYTCHPETDQEPNPRHPFPRLRPLMDGPMPED